MSAITAKASRKMKKYAVLTREPRCFLGSFDFSWEQRKLGDIASDMVAGGDIDKDLILAEGQYPVIANALTGDGIVGYYDKEYRVNAPAVTVTGRGDVGHAKARLVNFTPVVRLLSVKSEHDVFFLENAINTLKIVIESTGVPQLTVPQLAKYEVAFPRQLDEEEHIGAFFKQLDHLITLHQRKCVFLFGFFQAFISMIFTASTFSWEQRKLGDIADIVGGGTPSTGNQSYWDGDIDWYAPAEIADQIYASSSQKKITGLGYENSSAKMLPPGTVLFTSRAGIGKTAILTRKGCTNQGFQSIVPHRGELDSYFIFSRTEELKRYGELVGAGSTFVEVSGKQMAVMELMMPPTMREQQTIGGFFQQLDNLITLHQRECISFTARAGRLILTANKKRNTSSWEQRKLGDIADIVGGGTPSTGNQSYWDGDIDWYAPAEIADQIYASSSQKKITGLGYENSSAKMLPPGTVLFTSRAGIGKTAILTRKGCTNQGFQSIVPHRGELDSYFIFSRTEELKRYGELVGAGSTFVEVSGKQMAVMELMMPPTMREQQTIGGFFQQLDNLITLHQRKPFIMKWRTSDANRNQTNRLVL